MKFYRSHVRSKKMYLWPKGSWVYNLCFKGWTVKFKLQTGKLHLILLSPPTWLQNRGGYIPDSLKTEYQSLPNTWMLERCYTCTAEIASAARAIQKQLPSTGVSGVPLNFPGPLESRFKHWSYKQKTACAMQEIPAYLSPTDAVTNYHKCGGFNHKFILLNSGDVKSKTSLNLRCWQSCFLQEAEGRLSVCLSQCKELPGIPGPFFTSLWPLCLCHMFHDFPVVKCPSVFFLQGTYYILDPSI